MDKKFNLFISIFISIFIYLLLILSFFLYIKQENIEKFSAQSEPVTIELDFLLEQNEVLEKEQEEESSSPNVESTAVESKQIVNDVQQNVNTQSLFGNFNPKSEKIVKKDLLQENANPLNSRFESKITSQENEKKSFELSKLIDLKQVSAVTKSQSSAASDNKYDEYYSKINKYILTRWYNFPFMTDIHYVVTANITISNDGSFNFVIVKNSGNSRIDEAIKEFLMQQRLIKYPVSPDKISKTIKINFKPNLE